MGVKDLWQILAPVKIHIPLTELKDQTLAVDLSIWVCEVSGMKQMQGVVVKPHLRNLFFRVSHLTHLGVKLVFVVDGEPPELKWGTMVQRQAARGGRGGWRGRGGRGEGGAVRKQGRSHFKAVLKECCEMLDYLGVPYVLSQGEAEAMCALLNKEGIVDACLTNDGDAFLYGAHTIYRNFTMDRKDSHVECYKMSEISRDLDLDREKLVGLGLLLGCDYCPKGVPGVGKEIAIRFMNTVGKASVLDRFQAWQRNKAMYLGKQDVKKVVHCTVCLHPGSSKAHEKSGCSLCDSQQFCEPHDYDYVCPCDWHQLQAERGRNAAEIAVRHKALVTPGFPDLKVVHEFLHAKDTTHNVSLKWTRPQMFHFQRFTTSKLEWVEEYSLEKVLPLVTLYDLRNLQEKGHSKVKRFLNPHSIVKTRVRQGVPCLEIEWDKVEGDTIWQGEYYITIEERELFQAAFPLIVECFEQAKAQAKKPARKSRKKQPAQEDVRETNSQSPVASHDSVDSDMASALKSLALDDPAPSRPVQRSTTRANHISSSVDGRKPAANGILAARERANQILEQQSCDQAKLTNHQCLGQKTTTDFAASSDDDDNDDEELFSVGDKTKHTSTSRQKPSPTSKAIDSFSSLLHNTSFGSADEVEMVPLSQRLKMMALSTRKTEESQRTDDRLMKNTKDCVQTRMIPSTGNTVIPSQNCKLSPGLKPVEPKSPEKPSYIESTGNPEYCEDPRDLDPKAEESLADYRNAQSDLSDAEGAGTINMNSCRAIESKHVEEPSDSDFRIDHQNPKASNDRPVVEVSQSHDITDLAARLQKRCAPVRVPKKVKKSSKSKMEKLHALFHDETSLFDVSSSSVQSPAMLQCRGSRLGSLQSTPAQGPGIPSEARIIAQHCSPIGNSPTMPASRSSAPFNASQLGTFNIELSLLNNLSSLSDVSLCADRSSVLHSSVLVEDYHHGNSVGDDSNHGNIVDAVGKHGNIVDAGSYNGNSGDADGHHGNMDADGNHGNIVGDADDDRGNFIVDAETYHGNSGDADGNHGNSVGADNSHGNSVDADGNYGNSVDAEGSHGNSVDNDSNHGNIQVEGSDVKVRSAVCGHSGSGETNKENIPDSLCIVRDRAIIPRNTPDLDFRKHPVSVKEPAVMESPISLTERLRLRLSKNSQSRALAGLQTMSQSSSEYEPNSAHRVSDDDDDNESLDSSDVLFLD